MKNIILQHWTGKMNTLGYHSSSNIQTYAKQLGAEYKLLRGNVFRNHLSPPCQKVYMLDKVFDEYDIVVMLDIDMFVTKDLKENIFNIEGVGLFSAHTASIFKGMCKLFPRLTNSNYAYWGGAIYKMDRTLRQTLRQHIQEDEIKQFSGTGNYEDEGTMHRLATLAKIKQSRIPDRWCQCSFLPNPERAAIIHVRTKVTPTGPKRAKLENYKDLVTKGILE